MGRSIAAVAVGITGIVVPPGRRFAQGMPLPVAWAFERSRCRGGRFAWFDRAIAMSQNKIGVSRKMSIEYPYKQLPCQTQGGFLQTALSAVTRRSRSCSSPVLLRRVTPDRVLVSSAIQSENFSLTNSPTPRPRVDRECCDRQLRSCCQVVAVGLAADQTGCWPRGHIPACGTAQTSERRVPLCR